MKKGLMLVLVALVSMVTFAQNENITWNAKVGMNMSNFTGDMETDMRVGFNLGVGMEYHFTDVWSLAPSVMFTQKGGKTEAEESGYKASVKYNPLYLQIPVQALARISIMDNQNFVVKAGPYFAVGIAGKAKTELSDGESNISTKEDFFGDGVKRFDCGLALGVAYEIDKFFVALDGEFGFTKVMDLGEGVNSPHNMNFSIGVGYNF